MADQQGKKDGRADKPVAADMWSEISHFAWKRRPGAVQPPILAKQVSARTA
jgi:hypothetical protein